MSDSGIEYAKSCVVIKTHKISQQAQEWLVDKIRADKLNHGCQLDVKVCGTEDHQTLLIVSASSFRLRVGAEMFGIRKKYMDGSMQEFNAADARNFLNHEDQDFISDSDGLFIIKSELDLLRATTEDKHIPGHEHITLYPGKSIVQKMKSAKLITDIMCLHDSTKLDKLAANWCWHMSITTKQPIAEIRSYFGDSIGMYFSFLGFYTNALIVLVLLLLPGFMIRRSGSESYPMLAILNLIWASIFLELWKRKSADTAYEFGSFQKREWEEPRSSYHGPLGRNPITGTQEPCYPNWKRKLRIFFVSLPVVTLCVLFASALMFYYFSWDTYFASLYDGSTSVFGKIARNLPSILYSCVILLANMSYRKLAEYLTDQENHRVESSYQSHLITKIVLFDFVNNFLCLFYIAFIYNNMDMLCRTLRNLFVVQIFLSQTMESLVPYWRYLQRSGDSDSKEAFNAETQAKMDLKKDIYAGTFDDYLELWLQFGYVVMFSCVFPYASVLALFNNLVEIRSDAFKMCSVFRRPYSVPTRNIGAWQIAFELISYLGVITNCAIIFQSDNFQKWFSDEDSSAAAITLLLAFFVTEHLLLVARFLLSAAIPNVPEHVSMAVAKLRYKSIQALKNQRSRLLPPSEVLKKKLFQIRFRNQAKTSSSGPDETLSD